MLKAVVSSERPDLPNVAPDLFNQPDRAQLSKAATSTHAPRILLLYGSLRERSYSKLLTLEAQRLLNAMGAETRVYDPAGLPLPDGHPESHPKVQELRQLAAWARRYGLDLTGTPWGNDRRHEGADRLDSTEHRVRASDTG